MIRCNHDSKCPGGGTVRKKVLKRAMGILCCLMIFLGQAVNAQAEEKIIPSRKNYEATFRDASNVFICNEKKVDWKVGDKYFLTYTVKEMTANNNKQSGMIVTTDRSAYFPYLSGSMIYQQTPVLCEEGYTYFFRFEATEDGWKYTAAKAKGEESEYIQLPAVYGELKNMGPYFGIWLGEGKGLTAELTRIRCYDANGTDLGVYAPQASAIRISEMNPVEGVEHTYAFSLEDAWCVSFGNARRTESDVVFLEYTISNVKAEKVTQSGALMTNSPTANYPFGDKIGYLNYTTHTGNDTSGLITEGASYLVRFERGTDKFDVLVERTLANGAADYISFTSRYGSYSPDYGYIGMWIGEVCSLSADFTNVKCYDGDGKNLGIQTNRGVKILHYGDLEDYSLCEAVYYCRENNTFISLDDECNASVYLDGDESSSQGTYGIRQGIMSLKIGDETEKFDYFYSSFTDRDGKRYVRLNESTVTFHWEFMGGDVIETAKVTAEDGFKVARPDDPVKEGKTFSCWKTGDGKQYDFSEVVTDTIDLYASWEGEDQWTMTGISGVESNTAAPAVVAAVCVALIGLTAVVIVCMNRRRKHGNTEKEEG